MKRKILKFIVLTISVLVMTLIFAVPSSAETTVIDVGDLDIVSIDVPSGAQVTKWSCTPYGYVTFEDPSNSGNTYSTWITAELPGTVTIKATVKYADNSTSTVTVKTYLNVLKNGIYTIGNDYADNYYSSSGEFYLRSQITYPTSSGLYVAQHSQNNFGDETNKIYNYWRITYLGSEQYTIRSVADENKYLSYSGSTLSLANVTGSVTTAQKWYIRGEKIIPVSNTSKCLILASNSPSGTYHTDGNVYYYFNLNVNTVAGMEFENWSFTKVKKKGVLFVDDSSGELKTTFAKTYNIDKETIEFSELGYSLKIYHYENYPSPTIRWSSSKSSVVTINSNTGKLTLNGAGRAIITVTAEFAGQTENPFATYEIAVIVDEGTYFFEDIKTELYLGIEGGILSNENEIEQQGFSGENSQKWILDHVQSNIYTIKLSNSSSYYLGVKNDSATEGADIVLRTGNVTNGMKWRLEEGISGYKFISCLDSDEPLVLMTNSNNATAGEKLVLGEYTDDTNYRDEWNMYIVNYTFHVHHYYDEGFSVRFSDLNTDTESLIHSYQITVYERFMKIFGIQIIPQYYPYTSPADTCKKQLYNSVTSSTINKPCTHNSCHTTTSVLRDDLGDGTATKSIVIWTGHLMTNNSESNSKYERHSVVITPWKTSTFTDPTTYANSVANSNTYELLHELSHQLAAPDHYCYGKKENQICSNPACDLCVFGYEKARNCIMSTRLNISNFSNNMYCSDCMIKIKQHLANHH